MTMLTTHEHTSWLANKVRVYKSVAQFVLHRSKLKHTKAQVINIRIRQTNRSQVVFTITTIVDYTSQLLTILTQQQQQQSHITEANTRPRLRSHVVTMRVIQAEHRLGWSVQRTQQLPRVSPSPCHWRVQCSRSSHCRQQCLGS